MQKRKTQKNLAETSLTMLLFSCLVAACTSAQQVEDPISAGPTRQPEHIMADAGHPPELASDTSTDQDGPEPVRLSWQKLASVKPKDQVIFYKGSWWRWDQEGLYEAQTGQKLYQATQSTKLIAAAISPTKEYLLLLERSEQALAIVYFPTDLRDRPRTLRTIRFEYMPWTLLVQLVDTDWQLRFISPTRAALSAGEGPDAFLLWITEEHVGLPQEVEDTFVPLIRASCDPYFGLPCFAPQEGGIRSTRKNLKGWEEYAQAPTLSAEGFLRVHTTGVSLPPGPTLFFGNEGAAQYRCRQDEAFRLLPSAAQKEKIVEAWWLRDREGKFLWPIVMTEEGQLFAISKRKWIALALPATQKPLQLQRLKAFYDKSRMLNRAAQPDQLLLWTNQGLFFTSLPPTLLQRASHLLCP